MFSLWLSCLLSSVDIIVVKDVLTRIEYEGLSMYVEMNACCELVQGPVSVEDMGKQNILSTCTKILAIVIDTFLLMSILSH